MSTATEPRSRISAPIVGKIPLSMSLQSLKSDDISRGAGSLRESSYRFEVRYSHVPALFQPLAKWREASFCSASGTHNALSHCLPDHISHGIRRFPHHFWRGMGVGAEGESRTVMSQGPSELFPASKEQLTSLLFRAHLLQRHTHRCQHNRVYFAGGVRASGKVRNTPRLPFCFRWSCQAHRPAAAPVFLEYRLDLCCLQPGYDPGSSSADGPSRAEIPCSGTTAESTRSALPV